MSSFDSPFVIAVWWRSLLLTVVEGKISERWGDNRLCGYCATLLDDVPKRDRFDWTGDGRRGRPKVTQEGRWGAGVSSTRTYTNETSPGQAVGVWFIVGAPARHGAPHPRHLLRRAAGSRTMQTLSVTKHTPQQVRRRSPECEASSRRQSSRSPRRRSGRCSRNASSGPGSSRRARLGRTGSAGSRRTTSTATRSARPRALQALLHVRTAKPTRARLGEESVCMEFAAEFLPVTRTEARAGERGDPRRLRPASTRLQRGRTTLEQPPI